MFELHQIEQFLAVVECGTVSKAAEKLNITQPALSRSLQNLEYELKTPLFVRSKNKLVLTETGRFAAHQSRKLLAQASLLVNEVKDFYRTHAKLVIASCAPCETLFQIRDRVQEAFPGVACETLVEDESVIAKKLSEGVFPMALFSGQQKNRAFIQIPIKTEKLFAMIPETHPLAEKKAGLYFKDINGEPVIPFPLKGYWNDLLLKKLPDSQLLYQSNVASFDKVVHASNLISFESNLLPIDLEHHIRIPLLDSEAEITYHLAVLKSNGEQFRNVIAQVKNLTE
ncbi:MAG: LysR family transcriptional regulator [Treponema sp.]|nr:LysR family transcriptional regulator [Treponema sp.]